MGAMAFYITSLTVVYSSIYSGADQRKHQSSASLAFVRGIHRWPVNSRHKGPVPRKMFPFDDVIMHHDTCYWVSRIYKPLPFMKKTFNYKRQVTNGFLSFLKGGKGPQRPGDRRMETHNGVKKKVKAVIMRNHRTHDYDSSMYWLWLKIDGNWLINLH